MIKRIDNTARLTMLLFSSSAILLPLSLQTISTELDLNLTQGGLLGFIPAMAQFLLLLLSSIYASRIHKVPFLRMAVIIASTALILFSRVNTFWTAILALIILNSGASLLEGLLTPLVEDMHPEDSGKKMNQLHAFWPAGTFLTVIVVGELLSRGISWRWPFFVLGLLFLIPAILFPLKTRKLWTPSGANIKQLKSILLHPVFWLMGMALFFAGGSEGAFAFWTASYIELDFGNLPRAASLGIASFALGMFIGRINASRLSDRWGLKKILIGTSLAALGISATFFLINTLPLLIIFLLFIGISLAPLWPSLQSYSARLVPVDSTMMMILLSCFGVPGYSTATLLMGMVGDQWGLKAAFIIAPLYLLLLLASLSLALFLSKKAQSQ
ncbi:MFS transporter [Spirochaeta cellobiosiphila]|uniref:MFS transporter n=1 Tax=Spirochaeta cellobiosiphila TaxID=504483 RepID=UPI00041B403D|nr:MFS transporter [Spirochaeta cellobiosiphila]